MRKPRSLVLLPIFVPVLLFAGCGSSTSPSAAPDGAVAGPGDAGKTATRSVDWADARVRTLIGKMTLAEKIAQLGHQAPAIPRLGVPAYDYWNEGLHGVLTDGATSFPQAIALASAWDPALLGRVATAISDEARGFNKLDGKGLTYWSPVVNMLRDPRWGRYEESYTEDPWLMARLGVAFVRGLQGDDPKYLKLVATPKHFVANNSEFNRHNGSSDVDEQLLREYYLPAFEATVVEGGAFSVMSAYNRVNGVPAPANPFLLQEVLRDEWGFPGYVVSDCGAINDIVQHHQFTATAAEAAAQGVRAGTDLNCGLTYQEQLQNALDQDLLAEVEVDRALERVLRARFLLGEFDPPEEVPYRAIGAEAIESEAHAELALEAARASIVLLKNDGILPLDRSTLRSLALIGPHANDVTLGGYSGYPTRRVRALDGVQAKLAGTGIAVEYQRGCDISEPQDPQTVARAVELARASDVAVVFVGTDAGILREEMDRPDWALPGDQGALIQAVHAANPRTVVVLVTAGPVAVDWAQQNVPAIVSTFYNGQEQGTAIADVLFGDTNPGGKLTTTWYTGDAPLPPIEDYDLRKGRTYLYYTGTPLYPFGHGLSYTTFTYSNFGISPEVIPPGGDATAVLTPGGMVTASLQVMNSGSRAGDEVVQLYVQDVAASVPRPIKSLRGFQKVHLEPGQVATVSFPLTAADLAFWDVRTHAWKVEDGVFNVSVGSSSADIRATATLSALGH